MRLFIAAAVLLFGGAVVSYAATPAPPTLAVLNFANRNPGDGWDWLEKGLADMLISDLSATDKLQVVAREDMQALFEEMRLGQTGVLSAGTEQQFGRVATVDRVLAGSFWVERGLMTIEAHITTVDTGEPVRCEQIQGEAKTAFSLEKDLALAIVKRLDVPLTEAERHALLRLPTLSIGAAAQYYRGLTFWDRGMPYEALTSFRGAGKEDSAYDEAHIREGQMYLAVGEAHHAAAAFGGALRARPQTPLKADLCYWLGTLHLSLLNDPSESLRYFRMLRECSSGAFALRTVRAFSYTDLGTLPPEAAAALLEARALTKTGAYTEAAAIYAQLYKPFIRSKPVFQKLGTTDEFGEFHQADPGSDLLNREIERFMATGCAEYGIVPAMPAAMVVLGGDAEHYEEDYNTNKRFNDGYRVFSVQAPPERSTPDDYRIAAVGASAISTLVVAVESELGAEVEAYGMLGEGTVAGNIVRKYRPPVRFNAGAQTRTIRFDPPAQLVDFRIGALDHRLIRWTVHAKTVPVPRETVLRVDTQPQKAYVWLDGKAMGLSPLVLLCQGEGRHVLRAQTRIDQFGVYASAEQEITLVKGQASEVILPLEKIKDGLPGWGPAELIKCGEGTWGLDGLQVLSVFSAQRSEAAELQGDVVFCPDGTARAFIAMGGDIWTAAAARPGEWSAPERLPLPLNTFETEETPRCVVLPDNSLLLAWGIPQKGRYGMYVSHSADGRRWSFPCRAATASNIPLGMDLVSSPSGSAYLAWDSSDEFSGESGVFIQEIGPKGPIGGRRLAVPAKYCGSNFPRPLLMFEPAGRAHLFVSGRHIGSDDMQRWEEPELFQSENLRPGNGYLGYIAPDGEAVLTFNGGTRVSVLYASRDMIQWRNVGSLPTGHTARFRTQPNGLPALIWVEAGGLCLARATEKEPGRLPTH